MREGVVVEFLIRNNEKVDRIFNFSFQGNFDLRPTWLGERTHMKDDLDDVQFLKSENVLLAKDKSNPWFAVVGSSLAPEGFSLESVGCSGADISKANGASLLFQVSIEAGGQAIIPIYIAGSYHSQAEALATFSNIRQGAIASLIDKIARYDSIKNTARIEVPDTTLQRMLEWVKYSTDWLVRDVPEMGRGLSAGAPDYPWWFGCDSEYLTHSNMR